MRSGVRAVAVTGAVVLLLAGAALAGCSDDAPSPGADRAGATSSTLPPDTTAAIVEPPGTPATGCPVGNWSIPPDQIQGFYAAVGNTVDSEFTASGTTAIAFRPDHTFAYLLDGFHLDTSSGGTETMVDLSGMVTGTFTVADGRLATADVVPAVTGTATVGGHVIDAGPTVSALMSSFPFDGAMVDCTASDLTLTFDIGGVDGTVRALAA